MIRSALLAVGLVAAAATTAAAQSYYPYYSPSNPYSFYSGSVYPPYSYPYASSFSYPYGYGYSSYYGWPYSWSYPAPSYQKTPPSYADPYVYARPYSDGAGPAPN